MADDELDALDLKITQKIHSKNNVSPEVEYSSESESESENELLDNFKSTQISKKLRGSNNSS